MTNDMLMKWGGKGLGALGALYAGFAQARGLQASARAKAQEAQALRERGIWDQIRFNEDTRRLAGLQRALFGEAGVRMEGAPMDLMAQTKAARVLDRMQLAQNTAREVSALLDDARELRRAARRSKIGGAIGAFSRFF